LLAGTGGDVMEQMSSIAAMMEDSSYAKDMEDLRNIKVEVVKEEGDKATIKTTVGKKTNTEEMVKVEGKWVPKEMADDWDKEMEKARNLIRLGRVIPGPDHFVLADVSWEQYRRFMTRLREVVMTTPPAPAA
jgi:hypothetical protein